MGLASFGISGLVCCNLLMAFKLPRTNRLSPGRSRPDEAGSRKCWSGLKIEFGATGEHRDYPSAGDERRTTAGPPAAPGSRAARRSLSSSRLAIAAHELAPSSFR